MLLFGVWHLEMAGATCVGCHVMYSRPSGSCNLSDMPGPDGKWIIWDKGTPMSNNQHRETAPLLRRRKVWSQMPAPQRTPLLPQNIPISLSLSIHIYTFYARQFLRSVLIHVYSIFNWASSLQGFGKPEHDLMSKSPCFEVPNEERGYSELDYPIHIWK